MVARALLVLLLLVVGLPLRAEGDPRAVVQQLSDRLIDVMKNAGQLGFDGRAEKLRPVVATCYDMNAMTKGTLGLAASRLSAEDTSMLAEAYTRYSAAIYAEQFNGWDGERFEVGEPHPSENGMVIVPSQIIPTTGAPTRIDYLMHEEGGQWKIVDVLFDGSVSQVAVRRSEFVPIFRREGIKGLVSVLDSKTAALAAK